MSVKKDRLSGPSQLTNAAVTQYTSPSATVTVIRHLHVSNPSVGTVNFTMSVGVDAAGTRLYDAFAILAGTVLDIFTLIVLQPAEIIQAFGSVTTTLVMEMDGDQITLG